MRSVFLAMILLLAEPALACEALRFATTNDSFGMGLGPARDDYRSFGARSEVRCGRVAVELEYAGFTNRSYRVPREGSRVDEISLLGSWALFDAPRLRFSGIGGLLTRGDFGGDRAQNGWHNVSGHPEVHLYKERGGTAPAFGASFELGVLDRRYLDLTALGASWIAPRYGAHAEASVRLRLGRDNFWVAPSIGWREGHRVRSDAMTASLDQEDGFFVRIEHEISFLWFRAEVALEDDYVGGVLGVDVAHGPQQAFQRPEVGFELGTMVTPQESVFARYRSISPYFGHRLGTTIEVVWGPYVASRVPAFPNVRAHYVEATIGNELSLFKPKPQLQANPYVRVGTGFRHEAIYAADEDYRGVATTQVVFAPEVGARLTTPVPWWDEGVLYGLTLFYRPVLAIPASTVDVLGEPQPLGVSRHTLGVGFTFVADP